MDQHFARDFIISLLCGDGPSLMADFKLFSTLYRTKKKSLWATDNLRITLNKTYIPITALLATNFQHLSSNAKNFKSSSQNVLSSH